ncbi:DNA polymerase III subunit delta [Gordonia hirsuta DSM 44140 = NBRC 16056]|uniref:DNA-directed DNA polymerase n=1 Tax=Gordonia hirsuta DSM 44140 = NBRC 16056 TaxID=1121927 RepID=L7L7R6_9ACTN|nr:DNA polymerase III subunit delta [Gordonia hirsuta]GAC57200.1 DNA polymerase III subunit delta [Gordonia hirsuta DSM 44140 = NBRC 16056]
MNDRLFLLLGDDDFLTGRVIKGLATERSRDAGEEVPVTRVRCGEVTAPEMAELLSPSLFAEERIVVIEAAAEAGKEPAALITATAQALPEGITMVVIHTGGGRQKSMVGVLRKAGAQEFDCAAPKWHSDRVDFVRKEFRQIGVRVSAEVVELVTELVGSDLRELSAACHQLVSDTGGKVDEASVRTYYVGRPEVTGFEVADKAVTGDLAGALESLAWAQHHGTARVLLADALAEAVHAIARVRSFGPGDKYSIASELGMPPGRVGKIQGQARAWDAASIGQAVLVVADLNGAVKGQAADADYALEHAVSTVARLRPRRGR